MYNGRRGPEVPWRPLNIFASQFDGVYDHLWPFGLPKSDLKIGFNNIIANILP